MPTPRQRHQKLDVQILKFVNKTASAQCAE